LWLWINPFRHDKTRQNYSLTGTDWNTLCGNFSNKIVQVQSYLKNCNMMSSQRLYNHQLNQVKNKYRIVCAGLQCKHCGWSSGSLIFSQHVVSPNDDSPTSFRLMTVRLMPFRLMSFCLMRVHALARTHALAQPRRVRFTPARTG